MTPKEREAFYDAEIAPALHAISKLCMEHGLSFLAVAEWEPGELGRTLSLQPAAGMGISTANLAAKANGNVDSLIMGMMRSARETGHSSICLKVLGVPLKAEPTHLQGTPS